MMGVEKVLRKLNVVQYESIILNKDGLELILMKPNERFMLEFGKSIEDSLKYLQNLKDKDNLDNFMKIVETLLIESIRHPDDYKLRIIVPDKTEDVLDFQIEFSEFNPKIDSEVLLAQKLITPYEYDVDSIGSSAGKIALFLLILRMIGILSAQKEAPKQKTEEESDKKKEDPKELENRKQIVEDYNKIESFPGDIKNSKEINNS